MVAIVIKVKAHGANQHLTLQAHTHSHGLTHTTRPQRGKGLSWSSHLSSPEPAAELRAAPLVSQKDPSAPGRGLCCY